MGVNPLMSVKIAVAMISSPPRFRDEGSATIRAII